MLAGTALTLAGCATTPALLAAAPGEVFPELEPLLAARAGPDALTIRIAAKGCAAKADFVFRVDRKNGHAVVAFARRRVEICKGATGSAELRFTYEELGVSHVERLVIANPLRPEGVK